MWVWSVPTTVLARRGALAALPERVAARARDALVVTDAGVRGAGPLVEHTRRALARSGVRTAVADVTEAHPRVETVLAMAGAARAGRLDAVVAIGGGRCLDTAKAVAAAVPEPALLDLSDPAWHGEGGAVVPAAGELGPPLPCFAVPTTVGTSSEVSATASLTVRDRRKLLVAPTLRPTLAVLDPVATRTLPRSLLLGGVFEAWARGLGPAVSSPAAPLQDALAVALCRTLLACGEAAAGPAGPAGPGDSPGDELRLQAALASAATQTSFQQLGRSPYGHVLWYLANELAAAAGITKIAALAALAPAWLAVAATGGEPRLGGAGRLLALAPAIVPEAAVTGAGDLAPLVAGRLRRWGLPAGLPETGGRCPEAAVLTERVVRSWGGGLAMLGGLTEGAIHEIFRTAAGPVRAVP
jgi:NADP-dependent alcohol dehydrogenase